MLDGDHIHDNKNPFGLHRHKKLFVCGIFALIIAFAAYSLAQTALDTANINNVFEVVINNTNLAPTILAEVPGTGERVIDVNYTASDYPLELFVFAHGMGSGTTLELSLFVNGTNVSEVSSKSLAGAETTHKSIVAIIPKGANYTVNITGYHHYEWREYPILSGKNGTLSINQSVINITNTSISDTQLDSKVNKSGDQMTGMLYIHGKSVVLATTGLTGTVSCNGLFNASWCNLSAPINATSGTVTFLNLSQNATYKNTTWENYILYNVSHNCSGCLLNYTGTVNNSDRFFNVTTGADLPYTILASGETQINLTGNESQFGKAINATNTYGNISNTTTTFIKFHGATSSEFLDATQPAYTNIVYEGVGKVSNVNSNVWWGVASTMADNCVDCLTMKQFSTNGYAIVFSGSTQTAEFTAGFITTGNWYRMTIKRHDSQADFYFDNTLFKTPITTNLPSVPMGLGMNFADSNTGSQNFSFIRKYPDGGIEPTYSQYLIIPQHAGNNTVYAIPQNQNISEIKTSNTSSITVNLSINASNQTQNIQMFSTSEPFNVLTNFTIAPNNDPIVSNPFLAGKGETFACIDNNGNLYNCDANKNQI